MSTDQNNNKEILLDIICEKKNAGSKALLAQLKRHGHEQPVVFVGSGTCGLGAGADKTMRAIRTYFEKNNMIVPIVEVGCIGLCSAEPIVDIQLPGKYRLSFSNVTEEKVNDLLDKVLKNEVPEEKLIGQMSVDGSTAWPELRGFWEHPFFRPQRRIVLKNCGIINPESIDEYIATGGYQQLHSIINHLSGEEVCRKVELSGLRGRGGGGFPAGKKWELARIQKNDTKYLICNADEGDPGAFMDRAVIEGDPHRLIEGMAIAAYGIGANKGYVYIRAEYPLAIKRLKVALDSARSFGLLGENILNSNFSFDIKIKMGAGAFVCGEETALIHSIEGYRGMPRPRPPFPSVSGLFGKPTVINNVETLSNLPGIFEMGIDAFSAIGTKGSKGTKVFALSGKVKNTGLVEIPMGTTIREIIFDIADGIKNDKKFKAVQIGGPSGGCITMENLGIEIDYETLIAVGAMMGSGGLVVMDEDNCMVDVAKFFMDFIQRESCGKCIPCREGTRRMLEILESITSKPKNNEANSTLERFKGVVQLEKLARVIKESSLCGLGQSAPNPVLSTLRWFRSEYESHIFERDCPTRVCTDLRTYKILTDKCTGCMACVKKCPTAAIFGAKKTPHFIDEEKCIGCGSCLDVCKFEAIEMK